MAIDLDVHGNTKPLEAAVQAAVNRIRRQPIKITVDDKGATQPLGNMKRGADEFTKSMEAANARILAFGASMAIINGVANAFKGMVKNLVEVEKAMADVNVVMGLSAQNLEKFSDGLFKVAKETGAAFRVAADAATEYARQGLGVEESLKRTRDALVLTRLTGMDSAEAVKSLTAAMNTYGTQIKDTTQLVSKFAAVDVKFAVSAQDFADAISRTGQSAQSAGVSIDELVGIVTAAQQKTARGGAVIGNALKTIFTKTGKTDTLNQLENLGIAVRDLEGNTIGAQRILNDLANTFDTLSAAQKAQITQTMGGLFHINILKAVLSDAAKQNGIMAEATRISAGATDEAIQKNEELRKTMSAVATETGLAIKQVSTQIGEIALAPGMEKILNSVKSLAEGLSGVLGDGESTGSSFATGLLKGIGNVITGPGLVVLAGVFFKLFGQALKFTKESLTSLVGVTTEKQKQKAIQTSLVALFGQNAALNKEMLRTDIGRTEKEKIILGLLKAQVVEANSLNKLTAGMAGTLYRKGYGANLTPVGKKAGGHIPNYANPERAQAAQGGYAAGSIRSMNMPGEGPVIYNSAETVKNFKGMSQPAIMPPHSSKAGKNYQQAFGDIHGFDPYAAGGYIPNFARIGLSNAKLASKIKRGEMTVDEAVAKGYTGGLAGKSVSKTSALKNQRFKHINPMGQQYVVLTASEGPDSASGSYFVGNKKMGSNRAYKYASAFKNKKGVNPAKVDVPFYSLDARDKDLNNGKNSPYKNAIYNGLKKSGEDLIEKILRDLGFSHKVGKRNILTDRDVSAMGGNVFEGTIASVLSDKNFDNYKSRGETARIDLPADDDLYRLFGVKGGSLGAEAKITSGRSNIKDAALKFYDMLMGGQAASGYIPNFADPLSDAIGREKAAGVPVSQIRVGSHGALMGKGNPLGLGVTNTHDEPNGLRDVFGANGFVPNYAVFQSSDFSQKNQEKANKLAQEANRHLEKRIESYKQGNRTMAQLEQSTKKIAQNYSLGSEAQKNVNSRLNNSIGMMDRLNSARKRTSSSLMRGGAGRVMSGMNSGYGMAAVGMMSGYVDDPRASQAMIGASTGGMIGQAAVAPMLASGVLAPLAPFAPAIGSAIGAIVGWTNAVDDSQEALKKAGAEKAQAILAAPVMQQAFGGMGEKRLESLVNLEKELESEFKIKYKTEERIAKVKESYGLPGRGRSSRVSIRDGGGPTEGKVLEERLVKEPILSLNVEAAEQRKDSLIQALQGLDPSTTFMGTDLKGEVGEDGKKIFKPKKFTTSSFLSQIEGLDITKLEDQEALKQAFQNALTLQQKINIDKEKEREGVILQLNAQRAILAAQQKAKEIQFDIKSSYAQIDSSLSLQAKLMGGFATEQQKAQMNYTKAVNKAAEKYATGAQSEEGQYRASMLEFSQNDVIANALKVNLAQRKVYESEISGEGNVLDLDAETKKIDLTKELLKLSNDELYAELKKANLNDQQLQALEDFKNSKGKNVEMLLKELGLSTKIAENEFKINDAIAKRKDLISNLQSGGALMSQVLGHAQAMRGMDAQVGAAQRLTDVGPGYQTRAEQEDFQIREKEIGLKNQIKTIRENATIRLQKEQTNLADIVLREKELATLEKQQYAVKHHKGIMADGTQVEFGENEQIRMQALIDEEDKRNQAKEKTQNAIDNIIEKSEKEISTAQKLVDLEKQRLVEKRKHETGPGAFDRGMSDTAESMREQVEYMDYELGKRIPTAFADGLAGAMTEAINGTKSIKEGLMDAAVGFLGMIQQAMMQKMAYQMVGAMGFSKGGNVRKYSKGGGVPAMVSNGEYVMGRDAVNKYGGSFMHGINAGGSIPGFASGGSVENDLLSKGKIRREGAPGGPAAQGSALAANFGGGRGFDSGRLYQRKAMSGAFYAQSGNVGLGEDTSAIQSILSEEERIRQEAEAKRQAKKAKRRKLLGMVASIGLMYGLNKMNLFGSSTPEITAPEGMTTTFSRNLNYGGPIRKYASGGHIAGKSGIDQIPAMLSEGEYVIRASSARQIGKPMLDQINAGKFNEGGSVSEIAGSSETGSTGGNTNNISISVNMERGSSNKQQQQDDSSGQNPADRSNDEQSNAQLAERIKQQVVSVIVEEQRPGGLLSD